MRRRTKLAVVAGGTAAVVAGGAFARARFRGRRSTIPKPVTGVFPNGMAYARWGSGPKTLLLMPGGPGNTVPSGMRLSMLLGVTRPLVEDGYTVWAVARKQDMPKGDTMADMAEDYAGPIADEFGGKVDLIVGVSYGGVIGFYLAARHPSASVTSPWWALPTMRTNRPRPSTTRSPSCSARAGTARPVP